MSTAESFGRRRRRRIYCVVPADRARLHDALREHFADDRDVDVIVELRAADRRQGADRRQFSRLPDIEQRQEGEPSGRRSAERRSPPKVVRRATGLDPTAAKGLVFVERLELGERLEDADTARLIARIRDGDSELFGEVYLRYFDRVYTYLRHALRSVGEAQDATQHVFLRALERLGDFEPARAPFRGWLFVIARNHALDRLARLSRAEPWEPSEVGRRLDTQSWGSEPSETWLLGRDLVREIDRLPPAEREVLVLRTVLQLSFAQVANRVGRSEDQVRALHSRATRSLRTRLRPRAMRGTAASVTL